jgi:hypothetical protein
MGDDAAQNLESGRVRDPGAPERPVRKEQMLLAGFVVCLIIGVLTVLLPELSGGDAAHKQPQPAPAK